MVHRRHKNADKITNTKLAWPEHQSSAGGICSICTREGFCEIGKKCRTAQTLFPEPFGIAQFGAEKTMSNMDDIQIIPELYGKGQIFSKIKTETILGGFRVSVPIIIAAMGSTKVAHDLSEEMSKGAALAGIPLVIGENMIATHGKKGLKKRIDAYLKNFDGKFGAVIVQGNGTDIKAGVFKAAKEFGAHGIELKLGQGAKQNLGGEIKFKGEEDAKKYSNMGYYVEKNPDGSFQRHAHPGDISTVDLKKTLVDLKKYKLPIWIKISVCTGLFKFLNDIKMIKKKYSVPIMAVIIDGHGGGTGMSPWLIMNETNLPSASIFSLVKKSMGFDIILAGGYSDGVDISKAIMLGASGVAMGRSFIIAANSKNHTAVLKDKLKISGSEGIENFISALKQEIQMVCAVQRIPDIKYLKTKRKNLFALDETSGKMFGINSDIISAIK